MEYSHRRDRGLSGTGLIVLSAARGSAGVWPFDVVIRKRQPNPRGRPQPDTPATPLDPTELERRLQRLTPRQKDCLRLVRPDHPSKMIARDLGISSLRVDSLVRDAMRTLGAATRFEGALILRAWELNQARSPDTHQLGASTVGVADAHISSSDPALNEQATGPPAVMIEATPGIQDHLSGAGLAFPGLFRRFRPHGSRPDGRRSPAFFAVAVSLVAILTAVGGVASLLFFFDWVAHG